MLILYIFEKNMMLLKFLLTAHVRLFIYFYCLSRNVRQLPIWHTDLTH